MKKKIGLVLILLLVFAGSTFAQLSIDGSVALSAVTLPNTTTVTPAVTPSIGIVYGFPKLDLLAGVDFNILIQQQDKDAYNYNNAYNAYNIGIYAGLAPKASLSEKWSLSFPLLVGFSFGVREKRNFVSVHTSGLSPESYTRFGINFRAGARAAYALSNNWSLYTGFLANIVSWTQTKNDRFANTTDNSTEFDYTFDAVNVFNSASIQLGVLYKF